MKDFGVIDIGGKKIHVTSDDEVPNERVFSTLLGMKIGDIMYPDVKVIKKGDKK